MKGLHLISGLPRSGSTLFCNIMNMNPNFNATASSAMLDLLVSMQASFSHNPTFKSSNRIEGYSNFIAGQKGFLEGFCSNGGKMQFDKNRAWPSHIAQIDEILGHKRTKVIWCYRNPIHVICSMENQHKKNPLIQHTEEAQSPGSMKTMSKRISMWLNDGSFLKRSVWDFNSAIESGYSHRIFIVDYMNLCLNPQETMNDVHDFLGEERYNYGKNNFKDLKQTTFESDSFNNHKYSHDIVPGSIKFSNPKPLTSEGFNNYDKIINEHFEFVNKYVASKVDLLEKI